MYGGLLNFFTVRISTDFARPARYNVGEVMGVATVWIDLLFFVNFCMDFQCLFLTAKLLHRPFRLWRSVLSASLGAAYACAALFLVSEGAVAFFADLSVCFLMCAGVFWDRSMHPRHLLAPFGVYFGVSFAVGGVMSGMASLISRADLPVGVSADRVSTGAFFLLAALGGITTFLWGRFCRRRAARRAVRLTVTAFGATLCVTGMVDTANLLRDPVGGRPVALLDSRAAGELLPRVLLDAATRGDTAALATLPAELSGRVRLIPAKTATGKGLLFAIAPDAALLDSGRGDVPVDILVAPVPLSTDDDDCRALLPAELFA